MIFDEEKRTITPAEGMMLTNGKILAEGVVYLGVNDAAENWKEVPAMSQEEFAEQLEAMAQAEKAYVDAVQNILDQFAQMKGYDNCNSVCTYGLSTDPIFRAEAIYMIGVRDRAWRTCYNILGEYQMGMREAPSIEGLIHELGLDALNWDDCPYEG